MNKGEWGKIRAFFDMKTEEGFILKGFKLINGTNGMFVGFPSQKGQDDQYYDTIYETGKKPRCPNGTRRNKKTGRCEPK